MRSETGDCGALYFKSGSADECQKSSHWQSCGVSERVRLTLKQTCLQEHEYKMWDVSLGAESC